MNQLNNNDKLIREFIYKTIKKHNKEAIKRYMDGLKKFNK
jgi:hypothetical protein